jgi:hypothetical protein
VSAVVAEVIIEEEATVEALQDLLRKEERRDEKIETTIIIEVTSTEPNVEIARMIVVNPTAFLFAVSTIEPLQKRSRRLFLNSEKLLTSTFLWTIIRGDQKVSVLSNLLTPMMPRKHVTLWTAKTLMEVRSKL